MIIKTGWIALNGFGINDSELLFIGLKTINHLYLYPIKPIFYNIPIAKRGMRVEGFI